MRSHDGDRPGRLVLLLALPTLLPACAVSAPAETDAPPEAVPHDVQLDFEDPAATVGTVMAGTSNAGPLDVRIDVVTAAGGRVTSEPGPSGNAARFPLAGGVGAGSAAVLVRPAGPDDTLAPAADPFRFGVDFVLDASAVDPTAVSGTDNGENLVQRGLFEDEHQYKLQVDHGVVSCRVAGTEGELVVKAATPVTPGIWYRVDCARDDAGLVLTVQVRGGDDWGPPQRWIVPGPTGGVELDSAVPLAIGAKVGRDAVIVRSASDQFNGVLDNVYVEISTPGPS